MPLLNQPRLLKKWALLAVAEHLEMISYGCIRGPLMHKLIENDAYLSVSSPFAHWPSNLLEELLEAVAEHRSVGRAALHQLIHPHLESFNFSCGVGDVFYAIQFIGERCQNLQKLDLSYISFVGPHLLSVLITRLPNIKSINFQMTPVTDQVLKQIGQCCRQLRHLDVSSAPISDRGLALLSRNEAGEALSSLVRLSILDTQITPYGMAKVFQVLPQLRQVGYEYMFQIFDHLSEVQSLSALKALPVRYHLTAIRGIRELNVAENVLTAAHMCPELESVALATGPRYIAGDELWHLTKLTRLTELSLTNGDTLPIDFLLHVAPVLQTIGKQLHSLILTRFANVDVAVVGINCPSLRNLALAEVCYFQPVNSVEANMFARLEALELWAVVGVKLSGLMIKQLLTFCNGIRNLLFRNCDALDDILINEILAVNPMTSLSHITLDGCHQVTVTPLLGLLNRENDLIRIRLWNNPQLDQNEYDMLDSTVKSGNMNVNVEWYPYTDYT